jgi:hypothetical protein
MKIWIVAVAGGLCTTAYVLSGARDRPAEPAPRAPPGRPVMAPPRPPRLETVSPRPSVAAPAIERTSEPTDAPAGKPARTAAEVRDGFELVFQAEPVDLAWSQRTAEALTRGVQAVLPVGSRLQHVECRGTLCRIETSHGDLAAYHSYVLGAFQDRDTRVTTSAMYATLIGEPAPGKPVASVAFVARDGNELPDLETLHGR